MVRKHTRRAAKAAFAVSLGVALLLGLTACGGGSSGTTTASSTGAAATTGASKPTVVLATKRPRCRCPSQSPSGSASRSPIPSAAAESSTCSAVLTSSRCPCAGMKRNASTNVCGVKASASVTRGSRG